MVPDSTRTIREPAIATWPTAWQGHNLRNILATLGHDVDVPWHALPQKLRHWILSTQENSTMPAYMG